VTASTRADLQKTSKARPAVGGSTDQGYDPVVELKMIAVLVEAGATLGSAIQAAGALRNGATIREAYELVELTSDHGEEELGVEVEAALRRELVRGAA